MSADLFDIHLGLVGFSTFMFLFLGTRTQRNAGYVAAGGLIMMLSWTGLVNVFVYQVVFPQHIELLQYSLFCGFAEAFTVFALALWTSGIFHWMIYNLPFQRREAR
jgi:hypothetical protein